MSFTNKKRKQQLSQFIFDNPQVSVNKSIEFMKKMTVVTISQITLLRKVFPESSFEERKWGGNKIQLLKGSVSESRTMIDWIKNVLEIVSQKQMKKIIFAIEKDDDGEEIIETYTFCFTYNLGEIKCHIQSMETDYEMEMKNTDEELPQDIKTKVLNLLTKNMNHISRLPPLPASFGLKIYLEFNDNVQEDFVLPKLFRPLDSIDFNFPADVHTQKVGHIDSKFITFALKAKSALLSHSVNSEELFSDPYNKEEESVNLGKQASSIYSSECQKENSETQKLTESISGYLDEKRLKCICEQEDDIDTIKCVCCSTYQHKPCYKLLVHQTVDKHICVSCHNSSDNRICTNVKLLDEQGKNEAMYRRALSLCESKKKVSINTFVSHLNLPRKEAMVIFGRLKDDGCFLHESKERSIRVVNMDNLKENVFNLHFNTANHSNLFSKASDEYIISSSKSGSEKRKCNMDGGVSQKHFKFLS